MQRAKMFTKNLWLILVLTLVTLALAVPNASSQIPQLVINVNTEKSTYHFRQLVEVYGNVTFDGDLVEEGLVAMQLEDPNNTTLALRTLPANTTPSESWTVEITSFMPTDSGGNPKTNFNKETFAYFKANIRNNNIFSNKTVLVTITLCDSDSTPFKLSWVITTIKPGATHEVLVSMYIDDCVSTGNATAYADVYTSWPKNGGYSYAPEKPATFIIVKQGVTASQTAEEGYASYRANFRLPPEAPLGTYTITVSAYYKGNTGAVNPTMFTREYELLGDVIFDHKIDIFDVVAVSLAYGSQGGDPDWNPEADLAFNGEVDIFDVVIVTGNYGTAY